MPSIHWALANMKIFGENRLQTYKIAFIAIIAIISYILSSYMSSMTCFRKIVFTFRNPKLFRELPNCLKNISCLPTRHQQCWLASQYSHVEHTSRIHSILLLFYSTIEPLHGSIIVFHDSLNSYLSNVFIFSSSTVFFLRSFFFFVYLIVLNILLYSYSSIISLLFIRYSFLCIKMVFINDFFSFIFIFFFFMKLSQESQDQIHHFLKQAF